MSVVATLQAAGALTSQDNHLAPQGARRRFRNLDLRHGCRSGRVAAGCILQKRSACSYKPRQQDTENLITSRNCREGCWPCLRPPHPRFSAMDWRCMPLLEIRPSLSGYRSCEPFPTLDAGVPFRDIWATFGISGETFIRKQLALLGIGKYSSTWSFISNNSTHSTTHYTNLELRNRQ